MSILAPVMKAESSQARNRTRLAASSGTPWRLTGAAASKPLRAASGVDPRALWTQPIAQTPDTGGGGADIESFRGTVQVQLGSNDDVAFGGSNRSRAHLGLCLRGASLYLDDDPVVLEGDLHA